MSEIEFLSPATRVDMADEWFDLATADHFWMQWRHQVLLQQLKRANRPIRTALEIGCGHGVVRQLVERDFDIPVDGCDLNQHALQLAKNGRGRLLVYNIFDRNPEMLEAYDLVLLMDVIEHLEDDLLFLKAALAHLKPKGLVAINVPALMGFYGKYDEVAGHKRRYDIAQIESLFRQTGVKRLSIRYWGFSLLPILFARKVVLRFVSRDRVICTGFAEQNAMVRRILRTIQRMETSMPFPMPIGTSLLAVGCRSDG
jgi:2-polyprenyl-3-methyl-5-hydroxy-6-metoxy-1,4-benzoquinol methylase